MKKARARWALSFADLCLLLLGFMIILVARPDGAALAGGLRSAMGQNARAEQRAAVLFDGGEAVLNANGRRFVRDFAQGVGNSHIRLTSQGTDIQTARFDGWELSAARLAAVARALQAEHIPADRIALSIDGTSGGGQKIGLETS